ncbi:hypothetical protein ACVVIH_04005 [Chryseobacterium arthrosphaerae]|uniref:hypothetical protein n=1 Tax=Chryseobacterium arthrosphaerae TaxID=651561 RepID=UPI003D350562
MEIINYLFSYNILLQFIGALFSIILTVTIIYIKRENDRKNRENFYNGQIGQDNILGDIKIKVDEELPKEDYLKLMVMWGVQPLLLVVLISLIDNSTDFKIFLCFGLIIFTFLHEFTFAASNSDKRGYQVLMLSVWLLSFILLSFEKNYSNKNQIDCKIFKKENSIRQQ